MNVVTADPDNAYTATSVKLFTQHATTLSAADVVALTYPSSRELEISDTSKPCVNGQVTQVKRDRRRHTQRHANLLDSPQNKDNPENVDEWRGHKKHQKRNGLGASSACNTGRAVADEHLAVRRFE